MNIHPREQAMAFLRRSQKILLTVSENFSGDEMCALLALQKVLRLEGKEVVAVSSNPLPKRLRFLGGGEIIKENLGEESDFVISISTERAVVDRVKYTLKDNSVDILISPKSGFFTPADVSFNQCAGKFDVIVTLGVDNLESLGKVFEEHTQLFAATPVVNIAISPSNEFFGKVNLVETACSSVCEVLFDLFRHTEPFSKHLDEDLATVLLAGIIDKTGSFLEPTTTASALEAAGGLQALGAKQSDIIDHIFKMKSLHTLKIWGRILGNLEMDSIHRIAWSAVSKADFELAEAKPEHVEDMADELLRHMKGAELAILFIEQKKNTVAQVRSSSAGTDLRRLHEILGGKGKMVRNGIDTVYEKKSLAEVQFEFLRAILHFQKQRLQIPDEVEMQKVELCQPHPAQTSFGMLKKNGKNGYPAVSPTPPEKIPFDAPFQPHEITGIVNGTPSDVPPGTKSAEITLDPGDSRIPDWLKKSFPKN